MVVAAIEEGLRKGWITNSDALFENLQSFLSDHGRAFYNIQRPDSNLDKGRIILERKGERIPEVIANDDQSIQIVPFKSGDEILSLRWVSGDRAQNKVLHRVERVPRWELFVQGILSLPK